MIGVKTLLLITLSSITLDVFHIHIKGVLHPDQDSQNIVDQ